MFDLDVGTRFHCNGRLYEVVELQSEPCGDCSIGGNACRMLDCESGLRHDNKDVCFKRVQE